MAIRSAPPAWVASARKAALSSDEPASERSVAWKARQRPSKLGDGVAGPSEVSDGVWDGVSEGVADGDPGDVVEVEDRSTRRHRASRWRTRRGLRPRCRCHPG